MPKPFLLGVEIEEAFFGKVMRKINALPGVVALHMDFDRKGKTSKSKSNGAGRPKNQFEDTGEEAILKLMKGGKKVRKQEIRDAFVAQGRSPKSIDSLIHKMKAAGTLSKPGRDSFAPGKKKG